MRAALLLGALLCAVVVAQVPTPHPTPLASSSFDDQRDAIRVVQVNSTLAPDQRLSVHALIIVHVYFDRPVFVYDADDLYLELGIWKAREHRWARARYVTPRPADNAIRFAYIVEKYDFSPFDSLDYARFDSLRGGVIEAATELCTPVNGGSSAFELDCPPVSRLLPVRGTTQLPAQNIVIDALPAEIVSIDSTTPGDLRYPEGEVINVRVHWSKPVELRRLNSAVNIFLNADLTVDAPLNTFASYVAGSGSDTWDFSYTVGEAQFAAPLNYEDMPLQNMAIFDLDGSEADLHPPQAEFSAIAGRTIIVDSLPPHPHFVDAYEPELRADRLYGIGDVLKIFVRWAEPVIIETLDRIRLETTISDDPIRFSSHGNGIDTFFNHTVVEGDETDVVNYNGEVDGQYSLLPRGAVAFDLSGNPAIWTLPPNITRFSPLLRRGITVDGIRPRIEGLTTTTPSGSYYNPLDVIIVAELSEDVQGFGFPYLELNNGGRAVFNEFIAPRQLFFRYSIGLCPTLGCDGETTTPRLEVTELVFNGSQWRDAARNDMSTVLPDDNLSTDIAIVPLQPVVVRGTLRDDPDAMVLPSQARQVEQATVTCMTEYRYSTWVNTSDVVDGDNLGHVDTVWPTGPGVASATMSAAGAFVIRDMQPNLFHCFVQLYPRASFEEDYSAHQTTFRLAPGEEQVLEMRLVPKPAMLSGEVRDVATGAQVECDESHCGAVSCTIPNVGTWPDLVTGSTILVDDDTKQFSAQATLYGSAQCVVTGVQCYTTDNRATQFARGSTNAVNFFVSYVPSLTGRVIDIDTGAPPACPTPDVSGNCGYLQCVRDGSGAAFPEPGGLVPVKQDGVFRACDFVGSDTVTCSFSFDGYVPSSQTFSVAQDVANDVGDVPLVSDIGRRRR